MKLLLKSTGLIVILFFFLVGARCGEGSSSGQFQLPAVNSSINIIKSD